MDFGPFVSGHRAFPKEHSPDVVLVRIQAETRFDCPFVGKRPVVGSLSWVEAVEELGSQTFADSMEAGARSQIVHTMVEAD